MNKFSYNDIIYVGSSKPLICRDGNIQYARSMDLNFITYNELPDIVTSGRYFILDISVGWTTSEDMDLIEKFINKVNKKNVSIRLVDQFSHQRDKEVYLRMMKLSIDHGIPIIGTYEVNYYDLDVELILPYPYLESEEVHKPSRYRNLNRLILTGADVKGIYPTREKLYGISSHSGIIDTLRHPGYSGKGWNTGKIGNGYMRLLSNYSFMACTTCVEDYELLKYIECAEVGCIPVGDIPSSLKCELWRYIIEIPREALNSAIEFDNWFSEMSRSCDIYRISASYRSIIKMMRGKELLEDRLLNYINSK